MLCGVAEADLLVEQESGRAVERPQWLLLQDRIRVGEVEARLFFPLCTRSQTTWRFWSDSQECLPHCGRVDHLFGQVTQGLEAPAAGLRVVAAESPRRALLVKPRPAAATASSWSALASVVRPARRRRRKTIPLLLLLTDPDQLEALEELLQQGQRHQLEEAPLGRRERSPMDSPCLGRLEDGGDGFTAATHQHSRIGDACGWTGHGDRRRMARRWDAPDPPLPRGG